MRRSLLGLLMVAALAACSDSIPTGARSPSVDRIRTVEIAGTLNEDINSLIALWPKGPFEAITAQWKTIKKKVAASQLTDAETKLFELASFILKQAPTMGEPPDDESRNAAASRLIAYMLLYVSGETITPPAGADNTGGVLTQDEPLTIVTPSGQAGAQFEEGSVSEDRIIVITQHPGTFGPCEGPLLTELCQYPLYYDISSLPDGPLLKVAKAAICPVETNGQLDAIHDRLRLAHPAPSDPADYVAGGTVRKVPSGEENIEILPLITQNFVICEDVEDPGPLTMKGGLLQRGARLASAVASRVGRLFTPRSAFAIDQGGGGEFTDFSPFNNVDPESELYATDGNAGNLLKVNATNGAGTVIGSLGVLQVPALAVDPTTGTMYGGHGAGTPTLYTVNRTTGAATLIGDSGLGFAAISALTFRSDGVLFAAVNIAGNGGTGADHLATINKTTGAATIIGPFGSCTGIVVPSSGGGSCTIEGIEGIAFAPSGTLLGSHSQRGIAGSPGLYSINTTSGAATFLTAILDGASNPASGGIVSLAFSSNGTLYGGTARAIGAATDGGYLVSINPGTGVFTSIGPATTGSSLSGLVFR